MNENAEGEVGNEQNKTIPKKWDFFLSFQMIINTSLVLEAFRLFFVLDNFCLFCSNYFKINVLNILYKS